jgi:nucleoside-triphosphatase THEP1
VKRKVLLTGRPGSGKTTLVKRVVNELAQSAGGFYTEEIRERGQRVGFKLVTLEGREAVLAHVDFKTPQRVGKYGLDLSALDTIGAEAIRTAVSTRELVVIDEIGPMEIRSAVFCNVVNDACADPRNDHREIIPVHRCDQEAKRRHCDHSSAEQSGPTHLRIVRAIHGLIQRNNSSKVSAFSGAAPSASLSK